MIAIQNTALTRNPITEPSTMNASQATMSAPTIFQNMAIPLPCLTDRPARYEPESHVPWRKARSQANVQGELRVPPDQPQPIGRQPGQSRCRPTATIRLDQTFMIILS